MSHHLDSPEAQKDPRLDISDVYLFKGNSGTVFVMDCNPKSGPNGCHPEAMYEFKIDKSGDATPDLTFRVTFGELEDGKQTVTVRQLTGHDAGSRTAEGKVVAKGSTNEVIEGDGGLKVFAGSAGDPFFTAGPVVMAVLPATTKGAKLDLGEFHASNAENAFGNSNVNAIVLEVPNDWLGEGEDISFWGTVALATDAGGWRQVQRCATPFMSLLFDYSQVHYGEGHADYNAMEPADDKKVLGEFVEKELVAVLKANETTDDPEGYAKDLTKKLIPSVMHYKVGSDAMFSAEEQNGRGLTDKACEAIFELVLNKHIDLGVDTSDASGQLRDEFPYLSLPV
jgi:hypothetical protein